MKNVRFQSQARVELIEQIAAYANVSVALGKRFAKAIERAVAAAADFPDMGSPYKYGTRRVFPKNFPYSVIYWRQEPGIVVVAIAHFQRQPGYWGERKNDR